MLSKKCERVLIVLKDTVVVKRLHIHEFHGHFGLLISLNFSFSKGRMIVNQTS